jgi:hypothetical protein
MITTRRSGKSQKDKRYLKVRHWAKRIMCLQTIEAVVKEVGSGGKVGLRLSPYSLEFNECYELDGVDATIALNVYLLKELNKLNLAYVHIVSARISGATHYLSMCCTSYSYSGVSVIMGHSSVQIPGKSLIRT